MGKPILNITTPWYHPHHHCKNLTLFEKLQIDVEIQAESTYQYFLTYTPASEYHAQ